MSHLIDLSRLVAAQQRCPEGLKRLATFVGAANAEPFTVLRACLKHPTDYGPAWVKTIPWTDEAP